MSELSDFFSIHFSDGKMFPYRHNERQARCVQCGKILSAGTGHRFSKTRFSEMRSGYWCFDCVCRLLENIEYWSWNRIAYQLFPANEDTIPIDGKQLAAAWRAGGYVELGRMLESQRSP